MSAVVARDEERHYVGVIMKPTFIAITILLILTSPSAFAHCDWINGPVVAAARIALAKGDVTPVLKWVPPADEAEIRSAFARTVAARASSAEARAVADQWFFETLVRIHRASEGEPYAGLKGAEYQPEAGIEMADHAIDSNSFADLEKSLAAAMRSELQKRFAAVAEAKKHAEENVEAGRRFVHAYAEFVHYVNGLHRSVAAEHAAAAHRE